MVLVDNFISPIKRDFTLFNFSMRSAVTRPNLIHSDSRRNAFSALCQYIFLHGFAGISLALPPSSETSDGGPRSDDGPRSDEGPRSDGESIEGRTLPSPRPSNSQAYSSTDDEVDGLRIRTPSEISARSSEIRPPCAFSLQKYQYTAEAGTSSSENSKASLKNRNALGFPSASSSTHSSGSLWAMEACPPPHFGKVPHLKTSPTPKPNTIGTDPATFQGGREGNHYSCDDHRFQ